LHRCGEEFAQMWRGICTDVERDSHNRGEYLTYIHWHVILLSKVIYVATLKKNYLVKKHNILNEIRANNMELQELRFFTIYLSKINPNDLNTRVVQFPIDDFRAIMELSSRININYMKNVTNSLLGKIVNVPDERGGYIGFQLFKECRVSLDDNGEWYVEIDAHDKALPLMFEFKQKYFTYQLWNALQLKSSNQLRMYEILKQYEKIGSRILSIPKLKSLLGIAETEYKLYADFRKQVLNVCQQSLTQHTDIAFTYEPYGKRGKCGKILSLRFFIKKNDNHVDKLTLPEFIKQQKEVSDNIHELSLYENRILFLSDACDNEFSIPEIKVLHDKMISLLPYGVLGDETKCFDYLSHKYRYMNMQNEKNKIKHRFKYMESIIGKD